MSIKTVAPHMLKAWLDKDEAVLVDVREPAEFHQAHIEGAILVPLNSISMAVLPQGAGKKLVLQCKAGGRSLSACEKLRAESPHIEFYNLEGGIGAWQAAGLPILRGNTK